jgi:hypothetical protein
MADHPTDDELKPEATEGFKVGEKKTIDEYHNLGMSNSSLASIDYMIFKKQSFSRKQ